MALVHPNMPQFKKGRAKKIMKEKLLTLSYKQVASRKSIKLESDNWKNAPNDSLYNNGELNDAVMRQAQEVQANLPPEFPSMIKSMLPSHVTGGFWLGLPKKFCNKHMPKQDTMLELEDENGVNSQAKYLTEKVGLSGGWRGFSIAHNLMQGDVLVFQLVKPNKFKVYIVRANGSQEVNAAIGLLTLEACKKEVISESRRADVREKEHRESELVSMSSFELVDQMNERKACSTSCTSDHSENESEDLGFDVFDGIRLCESAVDFKEVKSFEDFDILINGLVINPELSKHLQSKYYELCCSRRTFLHEHLLEGLNLKLAAGVIAETINIADAIRASKLTTPKESFSTWKMTLEAFRKLGMNVEFLIERLDRLMKLACISRQHKELSARRFIAEEMLKSLEAKILETKEETNRIDLEIQQLGANENCELIFEEVAKAPW